MIGVELPNRRLHQVAAPLGPDDQAGRDAAELDHVGNLYHAVEHAQAGVREIVRGAVLAQAEGVMHSACGRRLQMVAADAGMHEGADRRAIPAGRFNRRGAGANANVSRQRARSPKAARADAGDQFESTGRQAQTLVKRSEFRL